MFKSVFNCLEDWVRAGVVKMVGLPKDARANKLKDLYQLSELCFSVCVCVCVCVWITFGRQLR